MGSSQSQFASSFLAELQQEQLHVLVQDMGGYLIKRNFKVSAGARSRYSLYRSANCACAVAVSGRRLVVQVNRNFTLSIPHARVPGDQIEIRTDPKNLEWLEVKFDAGTMVNNASGTCTIRLKAGPEAANIVGLCNELAQQAAPLIARLAPESLPKAFLYGAPGTPVRIQKGSPPVHIPVL
ncbi:hypothetical protein M427DRAFT_54165 [Gonapodya prolifera JEL478]|uniref:Uncharacterized protein n=1 Tax=Gonapodya prolifera (strain JEL478) TaxID=1344416 RepID=A0A139AMD7_GONPJ|nr:hypothetical protein M427DRAFT_54165 [Gonapodya prolifera JEL478]|eukprot:KXS17937.1 hypothetical protein M427DRAFT_54165 [Gonapodya prolifera JEL478]